MGVGCRILADSQPLALIKIPLKYPWEENPMITVTRLNDKEIVVNCETILLIEANPDTTITTTTGLKLIVKESVEDIISKTKEYKRYIHTNI